MNKVLLQFVQIYWKSLTNSTILTNVESISNVRDSSIINNSCLTFRVTTQLIKKTNIFPKSTVILWIVDFRYPK